MITGILIPKRWINSMQQEYKYIGRTYHDGKSITFDKKASPVKENAPPASDKPGVQTESSDSKSNISNSNAEQSKEKIPYRRFDAKK